MQIYTVVVVKAEDDAPQSVAFASALNHMIVVAHHHAGCHKRRIHLLTRLALAYKIVMTLKVAHIASMMAHRCLDNALGNDPLRIEVNTLDTSCEQWSLGFQTSECNTHSHSVVLVNCFKLLRRHVHKHILVVQLRIVAMTPSAAFYIAEHTAAFGSRQRARQHLTKFREKRVFWIRGMHECPYLFISTRYCSISFIKKFAICQLCRHPIKRAIGYVNRVAVAHIKAIEHIIGIGKTKALTFAIAQESLCQTVFQSGIHTIDAIDGIGNSIEVEVLYTCQVTTYCSITEVFTRKTERIHFCNILEHTIHSAIGTSAREPHGSSAFKIIGTGMSVGCHLRSIRQSNTTYVLTYLALIYLPIILLQIREHIKRNVHINLSLIARAQCTCYKSYKNKEP